MSNKTDKSMNEYTWLSCKKFTCHLSSCRFLPICKAGKKRGKFRPIIQVDFNRKTSFMAVKCKSYEKEKDQTIGDVLENIKGEILDELDELGGAE